jgi:wobble nucleotide-excising tRNase
LRKESLSSGTSALISELTDILGGSVIEKGGRFYVKQPTGKLLEAHLLAEGHRKLAMLVRLIANGEIGKDTILLWDEPESGLNPKLITKVAKAIRRLAAAGVQVFVATHDYLLTGELSVLAEYKQKPDVPTRFFAFSRSDDDPAAPVSVQSGNLLQDLSDNPILKEFVAHYDREERLFAASQHKEGTAR